MSSTKGNTKSSKDDFDLDAIELPFTARSLCKSTLDMAKAILKQKGKAELNDYAEKFYPAFLNYVQAIDQENVKELMPSPAFQLLFQPPYSEEQLGKFLDAFWAETPENEEYFKLLFQDDNPLPATALLAVLFVHILVDEERLAFQEKNSSYEDIAKRLDTSVYNVSEMHALLSILKPSMENIQKTFARKAGASKGGAAKAQKTAELKEVVLMEDRVRYPHLNISASARAILAEIPNHYLQDEEGNELLQDPQQRFRAWIGKDRQERGNS